MLQIADRCGQRELTNYLLLLEAIMPGLKGKVCHPVKGPCLSRMCAISTHSIKQNICLVWPVLDPFIYCLKF